MIFLFHFQYHLHCYNLTDLWAYLTSMELITEGYRVVFEEKYTTWKQKILTLGSRYIVTRILGLDYADNIVVIASKSNTLSEFL